MSEVITNIYQLFNSFSWESFLDINESANFIKIKNTEDYILKKEGDFYKINFYDFNKIQNDIQKRDNYTTLFIHKDLNILNFINSWANEEKNNYGYNFIREISIFKKIFKEVKFVKISDQYSKELQKRGNALLIKPLKLRGLKKEITKISDRANSSRNSMLTFLVNQAKFDLLNKKTGKKTCTNKGDFDFLVNRFNLNTKKIKKDFLDYLNTSDINSLGILFDEMIKKEVFDIEYLKRLDNYIIKEKLENIVVNGKNILSLKSSDVKTKIAKDVINKLFSEEIKQLETVWQKFFEKYLLYLFFSYKKIVPKVELKNLDNLDKQYPDFIGVNHYDGIDIIEIKTHLKNILVWDSSHNNFAFSSEMSKAIIQTINYMDAISDGKIKKSKDKKDLLDFLNIDENLYRPKGVIIISSKNKISKNQNRLTEDQKKRLEKDFTKLRNSIHNIQIFTFDEILSIAERYTENINSNY